MDRRNMLINFRLTKNEAAALTQRAKDCGYSREKYIRSVLENRIPPDYYAMMRELHAIGNNLNQIAQKAHILNVMDVGRYDEALRKLTEVVRKIEETVLLPFKM